MSTFRFVYFFFFQAEDGIRDGDRAASLWEQIRNRAGGGHSDSTTGAAAAAQREDFIGVGRNHSEMPGERAKESLPVRRRAPRGFATAEQGRAQGGRHRAEAP